KECSDAFSRGRPNGKSQQLPVNCHTCGYGFTLPPNRVKNSERHFCSRKCQCEWQKSDEYSKILERGGTVEVKCDCCGNYFKKKKSEVEKSKYHFCSKKCVNSSVNIWLKESNPNPKKDKIKVNCYSCGKEK